MKLVFIESDLILSHLKEKDWLKEKTKQILKRAENGDFNLVTPITTLIEVYIVMVKEVLANQHLKCT